MPTPGPHEILVKVEAVGLCFSDLKLLKQFHDHPRKSEVVAGIEKSVLAGMQSYVPGNQPVVPGHEVVCRIVAVGDQVKQHQVGERCLVQTDYRQLPTAAGSNAAFGYNFEGGLQEYSLLDERVVIAPNGDRFLIPVGEERGASAIALVEPWACVEDSYVTVERNRVKAGGRLLVVVADGRTEEGIEQSFSSAGPPAEIKRMAPAEVAGLANESFDDIIYFGSDKATIEVLNDKLAYGGIINLVLGGKQIGELVSVGVGRVHYGGTRWIGTTGHDAAASYQNIPANGEVRPHDRVMVVGAGGPMGQMHVLRNVCLRAAGVSVVGTDFDDVRLETLRKKAEPLAQANGVSLRLVNTQTTPLSEKFSYIALMAPIGALVASAIHDADDGAIINIFAGIPAPTKHSARPRCLHRETLLHVRHQRIDDRRHADRPAQGGARWVRYERVGRCGERHGGRDRRHRLRRESHARRQDHRLPDAARRRPNPAQPTRLAVPHGGRETRRRQMDS